MWSRRWSVRGQPRLNTRIQVEEMLETWLRDGAKKSVTIRLTQELKAGTQDATEVRGCFFKPAVLLSTLPCPAMCHHKVTA